MVGELPSIKHQTSTSRETSNSKLPKADDKGTDKGCDQGFLRTWNRSSSRALKSDTAASVVETSSSPRNFPAVCFFTMN